MERNMDNDNKINSFSEEQTHKEVQLFLHDELQKLSFSKAAQYNLEQEYALTKNNKNRSVVIILAVCALVVVLLVMGLGFFITSQNKKIKVNIETFNDLNLKSLLNSAGRTEALYASAVQSRDFLAAQRDDELNAADQKRENDLYVLQSVSKVSNKNSIKKRTTEIQSEYAKTVKDIKEKYDSKIADAEKLVQSYKEQLSGFDSEKLSAAQASESVLDSQKLLNDIQMETMEKRYQARIDELKAQMAVQQREAVKQQREAVENVRKTYQAKIDLLDPDARSESKVQDEIILETGIPKTAVRTSEIEFHEHFDASKYTAGFKSPLQIFTSSVKNASVSLDELNTIANRFSTIPLENTIRHYVPAMQRLAYSITTNMAEAQQQMQGEIDGLNEKIAQKDTKLAEFEKIFETICASDPQNPAQACVTDASDKNALKLFVTKQGKAFFTAENPVVNAQLRDKKRVLCDLVVTKSGENYTAAPAKTAKNVNPALLETGAKIYFLPPEQPKN